MKQMLYNTKDRIKSITKEIETDFINKNILIKYMNSCFADSLSEHRIVKYLGNLKTISKILNKPFIECNKEDIVNLMAQIEQKEYAAWTKKDYKVTIKRFYKWLRETDDFPQEVKWIKTTLKQKDKKLPKDILTEEEIAQLIDSSTNIRTKCFIMLLYESGARIGELANMKIGDIDFDDYGSKIILDGKTGMRRIRLIKSDPFLRQLYNEHPLKDNPDAHLWLDKQNKTISYSAFNKIIKRLVNKSKIKKTISCHSLRHSRATILAQQLTQAELCAYLGWRQGSEMTQTYVHLASSDLDKKLLKLNGITIEDDTKNELILTPKKCPRCRIENMFNAKFCSSCGLVLDMKTAIKMDDWKSEKEKFFKDEQYKDLREEFFEWLKEKG